MTEQHPITPPPELVQQWCEQLFGCPDEPEINAYELVRLAAQYGADQELEACCELLTDEWGQWYGDRLRRFRRPKPPSLKEQALADLDKIESSDRGGYAVADLTAIRRALEAIND